ncbi:MAG TPA: hypothetical protein DD653_05615, partial [Marinilabiliales bacterium]|nr:hypothetical protein [Marinilabiliales bacterium]
KSGGIFFDQMFREHLCNLFILMRTKHLSRLVFQYGAFLLLQKLIKAIQQRYPGTKPASVPRIYKINYKLNGLAQVFF